MESLCGIKAHTIRTWEKRFDLLLPERVSNNIRRYNLEDVQLLMAITILLEYGHKISKLATLQRRNIELLLEGLKTDDARQQKCIRALVKHMFANDIEAFENELDDAILFFGIAVTIEQIIITFLEKINLTSYNDTTIETHFVVTAIRKKIILGIERMQPVSSSNRSALLFLPAGEHYDLLLLYANYLFKKKGVKVYYLGTNISLKNLETAINSVKPDLLNVYMADDHKFPLNDYSNLLISSFPDLPLFVTYAGMLNRAIELPAQIKYSRYDLLLNDVTLLF